MLDIELKEYEEVKIVLVEGKMNTASSPELGNYLTDLIEKGFNSILLDLKDVDYISSTGLRVILQTGKKLKTTGGKIVICGLNETLEEVFRMSGFSMMFDVTKNEEEGLTLF